MHLFFGFGPCCRFNPSCSEYSRIAVERHGLVTGLYLSLTRILKCRPFGGTGFDPVPDLARSK